MKRRGMISIVALAVLLGVILVASLWRGAPNAPSGGNPPPPSQSPQCRGSARCFEGTVNYVVDGDTLDVNDIRIRLVLVDTPERGQSGYDEAKEFLSALCLDSHALVDEDDHQTQGSYGRILAVVYCDGANANAALVNHGYGFWTYCDVSEFADEPWAVGCR